MLQQRSRAVFLLALLGCVGERETGPGSMTRPLSPQLAALLTNSGVQGPVAVFEALDGPVRRQVAFAAGRRFEVKRSSNQSGSTTGAMMLADIPPEEALFIRNPRGPRMLRRDSSITVGWSVFCLRQTPQGTEITRSFNSTIHQISNRVIDGTGGHLHTSGTKPVGGWTPDFGPLDAGGEFVTTYITQIASGDERMTLRYTPHDTPCTGILDSVVFVTATRVQGLVNMSSYPHMYFDPTPHPAHDSIFFIRASDENHVHRIADEYYRVSPQETGEQDSLKITSVSLKYGGLYDFETPWTIPHEVHKLGTDVDMNGRTSTSAEQHKVLIEIADRVTPARRCEPHPIYEPIKTHVHCYFGPPYGPKGQ